MTRFAATTLFILFCAALIVGGLFFYYKRQVGYMPEWYPLSSTKDEEAPKSHKPAESPNDDRSIESGGLIPKTPPLPRSGLSDSPQPSLLRYQTPADPSRILEMQLGQQGRMAIRQEELMPLLLQSMAAEGSDKMADAVRAAKATVQPGGITLEMIVDVDRIPRQELDAVGEKTVI